MLRHMLWIYFFQYQKGTDKNLPLSMSYHLCKPIQILFLKKLKIINVGLPFPDEGSITIVKEGLGNSNAIIIRARCFLLFYEMIVYSLI